MTASARRPADGRRLFLCTKSLTNDPQYPLALADPAHLAVKSAGVIEPLVPTARPEPKQSEAAGLPAASCSCDGFDVQIIQQDPPVTEPQSRSPLRQGLVLALVQVDGVAFAVFSELIDACRPGVADLKSLSCLNQWWATFAGGRVGSAKSVTKVLTRCADRLGDPKVTGHPNPPDQDLNHALQSIHSSSLVLEDRADTAGQQSAPVLQGSGELCVPQDSHQLLLAQVHMGNQAVLASIEVDDLGVKPLKHRLLAITHR